MGGLEAGGSAVSAPPFRAVPQRGARVDTSASMWSPSLAPCWFSSSLHSSAVSRLRSLPVGGWRLPHPALRTPKYGRRCFLRSIWSAPNRRIFHNQHRRIHARCQVPLLTGTLASDHLALELLHPTGEGDVIDVRVDKPAHAGIETLEVERSASPHLVE